MSMYLAKQAMLTQMEILLVMLEECLQLGEKESVSAKVKTVERIRKRRKTGSAYCVKTQVVSQHLLKQLKGGV